MIVEAIDRSLPLPPLTQKEVAEFYQRFREPIGKSRVQQIERRALQKLRQQFGEELARLLAEV